MPESTRSPAELLLLLQEARERYDGAWRECSTDELNAADECFDLLDRLLIALGLSDTNT